MIMAVMISVMIMVGMMMGVLMIIMIMIAMIVITLSVTMGMFVRTMMRIIMGSIATSAVISPWFRLKSSDFLGNRQPICLTISSSTLSGENRKYSAVISRGTWRFPK
jgi:hypothetical protein